MEWFEFGELVNILADCLVLVFLLVYLRQTAKRYRKLLFPVVFITLSHVFTVLEGLWSPMFFNTLEHLCFLLSILAASFVLFRFVSEETG